MDKTEDLSANVRISLLFDFHIVAYFHIRMDVQKTCQMRICHLIRISFMRVGGCGGGGGG